MAKVGRLSKQKSVMNIEANPLESGNIQTATMKVESLSDCAPIGPAELTSLISRLTALDSNEERLRILEDAKVPYLFTSEQLMKILDITTSIKTKIQMISQIGPRLLDPRAKTQQFLDLFRYSEEKSQVEEILKARNQAILSSQFSTASSTGGRGGGRGGLLAGRGGGRGGAGRGAPSQSTAASSTTSATNAVRPSVPQGAPQNVGTANTTNAFITPAKKLEVTTDLGPSHPFSPASATSTPGNEPVVSDIHDVFSFLDSMGSPSSARTSRRSIPSMGTIAERHTAGIEEEEDEDDSDDEEGNGKASQPVADDTSMTTTETAPSVSTMSSSPYVNSQLPTNSSITHNLSNGSIEGDSAAADAAVAIIAAIVAKETVTDKTPSEGSSKQESSETDSATAVDTAIDVVPIIESVQQNTSDIAAVVSNTQGSSVSNTSVDIIADLGPNEGLVLSHSSSRSESPALNVISLPVSSSSKDDGLALDLSARPRAMSNPDADQSNARNSISFTAGTLPLATKSSFRTNDKLAPVDRTALLRQSVHHSSFTVGTQQSDKDDELQAAAAASSQIRQVAAKIFAGGDKDSAVAVVTARTSVRRPGTLQRTQSEVISKELSHSTGSIQYQPPSSTSIISSAAVKKPIAAADDQAGRYAAKVNMSKESFLALQPSEPLAFNEAGEPLYDYKELLRRNYCKEYGDLKQAELQRYLTNEEFVLVFGKSKNEFDSQAKWRQVDQKKKAMLF